MHSCPSPSALRAVGVRSVVTAKPSVWVVSQVLRVLRVLSVLRRNGRYGLNQWGALLVVLGLRGV